MGKYASAITKTGLGIPGPDVCMTEAELPRLLEVTHDVDPKVRRLAAKNLCGCHVRADHPEIWDRILELLGNPDLHLRKWVRKVITAYRRTGGVNVL